MVEILWNVGEKTKVTIALPGETTHILHSHSYFQDSVTEKVKTLIQYRKSQYIIINNSPFFFKAQLISYKRFGRFTNIYEAIFLLCKYINLLHN